MSGLDLFTVMLICALTGLAFACAAYLWNECARRDELDRRYKQEIARATHHAMTNPSVSRVGRRAA